MGVIVSPAASSLLSLPFFGQEQLKAINLRGMGHRTPLTVDSSSSRCSVLSVPRSQRVRPSACSILTLQSLRACERGRICQGESVPVLLMAQAKGVLWPDKKGSRWA